MWLKNKLFVSLNDYLLTTLHGIKEIKDKGDVI